MRTYGAENIHNVGLFGHIGSGKTTLAEAMLFTSGAISRIGRVEDGTTTSDYDPDEQQHKMSMHLSLLPIEWGSAKINLIDAPGDADFQGDIAAAMSVVDGAVIVLDAASGIEVGSERVWEMATQTNVPRIIFINKLDRDNANFHRCIEQARELFDEAVTPLQIPIGSANTFRGVIGLRQQIAWFLSGKGDGTFIEGDVPPELDEEMHRWRTELIDKIAATNDDLIEHYFEGGEDALSSDELLRGLRCGIADGSIIPVFCGSAPQLAGIQQLLCGIVDSVPPAAEKEILATQAASGEEVILRADSSAPLAAFVFKTLADTYGKVSFFRVFSGTMPNGATIYNPRSNKDERNVHIFSACGKEQTAVPAISAGDIGIATKLADTSTNDMLTTHETPLQMAPVHFPAAAFTAVVKPHGRHDLDKLGLALARMVEEDPTLIVERDSHTGDTLLSGLSETHINLIAERMAHRFAVHVDVGLPRVPYRETLRTTATAHYRHKKQTGGAGQFADVTLRVEPLPPDPDRADPLEFVNEIVGGVISRGFMPAIEKGVREAMSEGVLAGNTIYNVRVAVCDGKEHPVDSKEIAFKTAGAHAFKLAAADAQPIITEPIYELEITVPEQYAGDVMSDMSTRRGRVLGMLPAENGCTTITAQVPLAECQRYCTDLRSITQARGRFTMQFVHYEEVPAYITQHLVEEHQHEGQAVAH